MLWLNLLLLGLTGATTPTGYDQIHWEAFTPSSYVNSSGLTDLVQWDGYSLFVNHERIFLYSGEVHPWRLIVPDLWPDVMQRIKALGFNAISLYTFWGLHEPTQGELDFEGWKNFEPFIEAAGDAGLWVVARPGPYINAEVTAGGIPGWVLNLDTDLRTNNATWTAAYEPYWKATGEIFARQQITNGGPIIGVQIENEYFLDDAGDLDLDYIVHLEELMRSYGIVVPFTFNDVNPALRLYEGKGAVDLYGVDSYPQSTDCSQPEVWRPVFTNFRPYFQNTSGSVGSPFYIPEFQAGWIPLTSTPGYDNCLQLFDSDFERVFYLNNIAQGVKMQSTYMIYGGTNFGKTSFPLGLTSYDYWAAISEDRTFKNKYYELKLIAHFLQAATSLRKTWVVESGNTSISASEPIQLDQYRNPDDDTGFYIVRHANSSSLATTSFDVPVSDWKGNTSFPVTLHGRDARVMVANYAWGSSRISTSASVFTSTTIGGRDVIVLWADAGDNQVLTVDGNVTQLAGSSTFSFNERINFTVAKDDHAVLQGDNTTVHIVDVTVAEFAWQVGVQGTDNVLVFGPYFVRNASCEDTTLHLVGDLNATTTAYVVADSKYTAITWNSVPVNISKEAGGMWRATLPGPTANGTATLGSWKRQNSLPEIGYGYDDSDWIDCDQTNTTNPNQPYGTFEGQYVLYSTEYGFFSGATIFRGYYQGGTALNVSISAGTPGVAAFWDNGVFAGTATVANVQGIEDVNVTIPLNHTEGVIQIVIDNTGFEENSHFAGVGYTLSSENILSPRGIRGYTLIGGDTSAMTWKVIGGVDKDKVRTLYNAGGFYGEREGWYLPGYDDSAWEQAGPDQTVAPGVWFYRTEVNVTYPAETDLHYSFVFPRTTGYRAQLWVNGWQFATVYADVGGPQFDFPIPPGVLKNGSNEVALSVFTLNGTMGDVQIKLDNVVTTTVLDLASLAVEMPTYQDLYA